MSESTLGESILNDVSVEDQFLRHVYEHETLISWLSDEQSVVFEEWLFEEGFIQFEKYYQKYLKENEAIDEQ